MKGMNEAFERTHPHNWVRNGWVRTLVVLTLSLTVLASSALAQSLAELADKEKKRRSEVKGTAKVISERELQTGRRVTSLPNDSAAAASNQGEGAVGSEETAAAAEPEVDETTTREYWLNRVNAANEKIAALEEKLQSPESDWGGGMRTDVNPVGQRNLSHRQEIESQLAAARAELAQIQDEARRAGVPAGWVR
jgi:hypothetical protein